MHTGAVALDRPTYSGANHATCDNSGRTLPADSVRRHRQEAGEARGRAAANVTGVPYKGRRVGRARRRSEGPRQPHSARRCRRQLCRKKTEAYNRADRLDVYAVVQVSLLLPFNEGYSPTAARTSIRGDRLDIYGCGTIGIASTFLVV